MAAAWIGFASGLIAIVVSIALAFHQARVDERLERVKTQFATDLEEVKTVLAAELHRTEALIDRDLEAEEILARYREPLAVAAFDLQSRIYNILRLDFFGKFGGSNPRAETALRTTLFRLAQYLGWTEILRRDIQFLSFPEADETRCVANLQSDIARALLTDAYGKAMMIWADEQRALGELIVTEQYGKVLPMGYATFEARCDDIFLPWLDRLRSEVKDPQAQQRLRHLQHLLCDLVETLDKNHVRYAHDLERA